MQNDLTRELGTNFIEYAVAVNTDRAIPDAKSGLKPVARRILYGAYAFGHSSNKVHVKCANIVGEVMGKFHPHGDSSIYGALARLSQPWVMRYPLIDWHGNNGNIAGDGPAAYRYTEARLAKLAEEGLLAGIKKNNVDFIPNYDESRDEPVTLPSFFPNLLCNPNTGIGVAMACNWLPHNLTEVSQAIRDYLDGKEPVLPGPDFPTGGLIINKDDIPNILKTGHGSVKLRGKYKLENTNIVFYEIPYGVSTESLLEEIGALAESGKADEITDIRDESNKKGLRIVIECRKDANLNKIISLLFKDTNLQTSISYNQVALIDKTPTELNLKDCIKIYVEHNIECIIREAEFDKVKAADRLEIVDGLLKALEDIDNIIALIKASASSATAKVELMNKYSFTENQAKAIIDMKLGKLAGLEKIELNDEKTSLEEEVKNLTEIIGSKQKQEEILWDRLSTIVKKYDDGRKTELTQIAESPKEKEIENVVPEECVVVITESGLIKRIPTKSYRTQKRSGVGVKNGDDIIKFVCRTNTIDTLMVFSSNAKMYRLIVDNIPEGTNASKGTPIQALISMETGEKPMAYASLYHGTSAKYVFFATKNGTVKKVPLSEYEKTKKATGIIALTLKEEDSLAAVTFIEEEEMLLATRGGMVIRFSSKDMPLSSRTAQGVKGMKLNAGDEVFTCIPIKHNTDNLAVVSYKGLGKQIELKEFVIQNRGGKGVSIYKEPIAGIALVDDTDDLLIFGDKTSIRIAAKELPVLSRTSVGNSVIKNNSKVVSISKA